MIFAPSKVGISGWHSLLQSHLLVGSDLHRPGEPAAEVPGLESGRCLCGECRSAGVAVGWDVLRTPVVYLCNVEIQKGGQMMWDRSWSYDHRYGVRFFWIKVERGELSNKSMWVFWNAYWTPLCWKISFYPEICNKMGIPTILTKPCGKCGG